MGQVRTVHALDGEADLSGYDGEVIGQNDSWTSFRPRKPKTFDSLPISADLGVVVFDMWFIDGEGIVARVHQHGMLVGVFALPERENAYNASDLAEVFEIHDALTKAQVKSLKKQAADRKGFTKWILSHGLEQLLRLPEAAPAPKAKPKAKTKKPAAKKK